MDSQNHWNPRELSATGCEKLEIARLRARRRQETYEHDFLRYYQSCEAYVEEYGHLGRDAIAEEVPQAS